MLPTNVSGFTNSPPPQVFLSVSSNALRELPPAVAAMSQLRVRRPAAPAAGRLEASMPLLLPCNTRVQPQGPTPAVTLPLLVTRCRGAGPAH